MPQRHLKYAHFVQKGCLLMMVIYLLVIGALVMKASRSESRYVLDAVPAEALVGTWHVNSSSYGGMYQAASLPGATDMHLPWQILQLNSDGTLVVTGRIVTQGGSWRFTPQTTSGEWAVEMDTPVYGDRPDAAAMVKLSIETVGTDDVREIHMYSLIIMDSAGELILWAPIGDQDGSQSKEYIRGK